MINLNMVTAAWLGAHVRVGVGKLSVMAQQRIVDEDTPNMSFLGFFPQGKKN